MHLHSSSASSTSSYFSPSAFSQTYFLESINDIKELTTSGLSLSYLYSYNIFYAKKTQSHGQQIYSFFMTKSVKCVLELIKLFPFGSSLVPTKTIAWMTLYLFYIESCFKEVVLPFFFNKLKQLLVSVDFAGHLLLYHLKSISKQSKGYILMSILVFKLLHDVPSKNMIDLN